MTNEQIIVSKALLWQAIEAFRWLMPDKKDDNHGGHDARDVREWRRTEAALREALEQTAFATRTAVEPVAKDAYEMADAILKERTKWIK